MFEEVEGGQGGEVRIYRCDKGLDREVGQCGDNEWTMISECNKASRVSSIYLHYLLVEEKRSMKTFRSRGVLNRELDCYRRQWKRSYPVLDSLKLASTEDRMALFMTIGAREARN